MNKKNNGVFIMKSTLKDIYRVLAVLLVMGLGAGTTFGADVVISSNITSSTTWTFDNTYILDGVIFVTNGATLTIEAGTVIRGRPDSQTSGANNPGTLVIAQGSKLFANGTAEWPIVFTDLNDDNVPGGAKVNPLYNNNPNNNISEQWGGVLLLGKTYVANDTAAGPNMNRTVQAEGLTSPNAVYGGGDDDDCSGSMTYVSIRYGGFGLEPNEEVNGLTLGAVGRETTLHHIEVVNNVDDGIEWFGGTVDSKYLVVWNVGDDSFDTDEGYRGRTQYGLIVKGACKAGEIESGGGVGDNAFEMDGGNSPDESEPFSRSQWRNITAIGMLADSDGAFGDTALTIRDNAQPQIYHSIFMNFGKNGVDIESPGSADSCDDAASVDEPFYLAQTQGFRTEVADNKFFDIGGTLDVTGVAACGIATENEVLASNPIQNVVQTPTGSFSIVTDLDPRPTAGAQGISRSLPNEGFFDTVDYYGAFSPHHDWTWGWTLISTMGVLDASTPGPVGTDVVISSNITSSTTWTSNNTYILDGVIFVTNGATLTIEAGTVIRGRPDSQTSGANNPGTLVIAQGSKLFANGTAEWPIVFTDLNDDNVPGGAKVNPLYNNNPNNNISEQWGGVLLLGKTYVANDTAAGPNMNRTVQAEGLTSPNAVYGGGDDDDCSGSISYVSIRYGGFGLEPNEEVNGLTLGAVGRETTLHHIEVVNNVDDGIEWFGGTVDSKYLVVWNVGDDSFDTDEGYRGRTQYGLIVKGACKAGEIESGGGVGDNAFEMDGGNSPDESEPFARSQWRNITAIGMLADSDGAFGDTALTIRDNAQPQIYHSIFMNFGKNGVDIESPGSADSCDDAASVDAPFYLAQTQGFRTEVADNKFFDIGGTLDVTGVAACGIATENEVLASNPIQNVVQTATGSFSIVTALDPRPTAGAQGISRSLPNEGFFDTVDYYGAFSPNHDWTIGWTLISSMGVLNATEPVTQTLTLAPFSSNPSLVSLYVEPDSLALADVLGDCMNSLLLIQDDSGNFFSPAHANAAGIDLGNLSELKLTEGYEIYVKSDVDEDLDCPVVGIPVKPKEITVVMEAFRVPNLVPYPFSHPSPLKVTFPKGFHEDLILLIQDDSGEFFSPPNGNAAGIELGNLGKSPQTLNPGEAYRVYLKDTSFEYSFNGMAPIVIE